MASLSFVAGAKVTVTSPVFVGADGETPSDPTSPALSVSSLRGLSYGTPTATASGSSTGTATAPLTLTEPDVLTLSWTGTVNAVTQTVTQTVDVTGNRIIAAATARTEADLAASYDLKVVARTIAEFQRIAEEYRGVSYVPRLFSDTWRGWASSHVQLSKALPIQLVSVSCDGEAITDAVLDGQIVYREGIAPFVPSDGELVVVYEHGHAAAPAALRRACVQYVRSVLNHDKSGTPRDAYQVTADGVSYRFSTPDWEAGRPTGWIEVDRLLNSLPYGKRAQ